MRSAEGRVASAGSQPSRGQVMMGATVRRAVLDILSPVFLAGRASSSGTAPAVERIMTRLLDGKQCASAWQQEMAADVRRIVDAAGRPPGLGVVLVGDRPDSHVYVLRKREACESIGVVSKVKYLEETCSQTNVRHAVQAMCKDGSIDGVLVQLPLPRHIDEEDVIEHFDPGKDVDGFHPLNVGRTLMRGRTARFVPCTAMGCIELLKRSGIELKQKSVVIVGDSNIVGMPLAMLFRDEGTSSVTVIHRSARGSGKGDARGDSNDSNCGRGPVSYQAGAREGSGTQGTHGGKDDEDARRGVIGVDEAEDPPHPYQVTYNSNKHIDPVNPFPDGDLDAIMRTTRSADILVVAVGSAKLVDSRWIKPGAIVLDVGINALPDIEQEGMEDDSTGNKPLYETLLRQHSHVVGDVDFDDVLGKAAWISPVPGGLGPMTVAALIRNTISSAAWRLGVEIRRA